ncbi:MAG: JAB domain-containing protein, partial [Caulobacteraceae bacterium]
MLEEKGGFALDLDRSAAPRLWPRERNPHQGPDPAPHAGHRQRLRTRAAISLQATPDYEILELLLMRCFRRGDVKPLAKALLARFGSLAAVLGASLEELKSVGGVGAGAALDLKLIHEAALRIGRGEAKKR